MSTVNSETIGETFQEYTKYRYFRSASDMSAGLPEPPPQKPIPPGAERTDLPEVEKTLAEPTTDFCKTLAARRSRRDYADSPVKLDELAMLLWATQGVTAVIDGYALRASPSAGARYPLETYLGVCRTERLQAGLYRYLPLDHQLVRLRSDETIGDQVAQACLGQQMLADCGASFIWSAVIDRARWKYQQRAYRYIYLDAGHACQNLYLACEVLGLGCCGVAAFDDDAMNRVIGADGKKEFVIYLAAVGRRAK